MKTLQSPKASPGKLSTPKKASAGSQNEATIGVSPLRSAKSDKSDRSAQKSAETKNSRKDANFQQNQTSSQHMSTEKSSQQATFPRQIDIKMVKQLNMRLAASASQPTRDSALNELHDLLVAKKLWFQSSEEDRKIVEDTAHSEAWDITGAKGGKITQKIKNVRMVWQGLFFMIWHSDKSLYQRECCEKIANIMDGLGDVERKKEWFTQFLYIFNLNWDKIDNYRIDKYLMFLRFQFKQLLKFLQKNQKDAPLLQWYQAVVLKLFVNSKTQGEIIANGIPLQICDVFVAEMNNVDSDATLVRIAGLLDPFLKALGQLPNGEIKERIIDKIFHPLLENNKTQSAEDSSDEEEKLKEQLHKHRYIDGGKMNPRTQKRVSEQINRKYVFNGFNILIYAQNYIFKFASSSDASFIKEANRDQVYKLYEYALLLEPKPDREELTFAQQQLVNKARSFVTIKMKRRQNMRDQKKEGKNLKKLRKLISDQFMSQHMTPAQEVEWDTLPEVDQEDQEENTTSSKAPKQTKDKDKGDAKTALKKVIKGGKIVMEAIDDDGNDEDDVPIVRVKAGKTQKQKDAKKVPAEEQDEDDEVLNINQGTKKNKKRAKKRRAGEMSQDPKKDASTAGGGELAKKRVHFDLSQNKVTEFFKHGKVAQRAIVD